MEDEQHSLHDDVHFSVPESCLVEEDEDVDVGSADLVSVKDSTMETLMDGNVTVCVAPSVVALDGVSTFGIEDTEIAVGCSNDDELCSEVVELDDGMKGWIPIVPESYKPKLNEHFDSYVAAETKYRLYAFKAGFDVRLNAKKMNSDKCIQTRWFVCSKEGNPRKKEFDSLDVGTDVRRGRNSNVKRSGCRACMKIHLTKDKNGYEVYEFFEMHNHVLFNESDRRFSKTNRKMQYTDFRNVLRSSTHKVGPTRAYRLQTALKGGFDKMRCTAVDYQNFKRDVGLYVGKKDAKMLINKIHAMAFVPFLAIDNHKRSVVVGSSLIAGENIENFKWVLRAFLKCYKKQPIVVITDQCSAMKQAVPCVLNESKHRLCIWHIMKKVPKKVSQALNQNARFNSLIKKLVWNVHIGPDEFEYQWNEMIIEFDLVNDPWFSKIYNIRHSWIPAFFKDTPMSGLMKTTSRSESANAFFNLYSSFESDLVEFLMNYDSALEKQRDLHAHDENVTRTTYPQLMNPIGIEHHAAQVYTRTIFFDFQKELKKAIWYCGIDRVEDIGDEKVYVITHQNKKRVLKVSYKVVHNVNDNLVDYECSFFVRNGFLCRHALKVLLNCQVDRIPYMYVARRWTRELVPAHVQPAAVRYREIDSEKELLFTKMYSVVDDVASRIRNDKTKMTRFYEYLDKYKLELSTRLPNEDPTQQKVDAIAEHFGVAVPDDVDVYAPTGLANKGCALGKRLRSTSEKIQMRSKKPKRRCKRCGESKGHDSRNCPMVS
ncbi:hypothetical protein OSB04_019828 [Centaurea solstitialis]|uniref:SWIM-type domain-containing protein n=1 Tax=Centaurea solstitialis TaxID=347529 RepID=A0AA38T3A5_9ASTR|nr:hypothetical protein OSB04_019828 [Centaurea solstitialis]